MKFNTHFSFGILVAFFTIYFLKPEHSIILFFLIALFSILPDIDLHTSYIGKKVKIFSFTFEFMLGHRGIFHSLWVPILLYVVLAKFGLELAVIGYLSHLLLDMFNRKGIKLFWPILGLHGDYLTGGLVDSLLFYVFFVADFLIFLNLIYPHIF